MPPNAGFGPSVIEKSMSRRPGWEVEAHPSAGLEETVMTWEPSVVAFCCNWCAYAGADLAGVSRFQYPTNVKVVRVMCSGRVEPSYVLRCFRNGADGVMVLGCHIGDCHYFKGNERARQRIADTGDILERLGIGRERLLLRWISAGEGALFASTCREFVELVRSLGPLPEVGCDQP